MLQSKQVLWGVIASVGIAASADAIVINVRARVNGTANQTIGSINATLDQNGGGAYVNNGRFTFAQGFGVLDDCYDFRWYQHIRYDDCPATYRGNASPPAGQANMAFVDPPLDGWDYQRTPAGDWQMGTAGADRAPFYENNDDGNAYAYPSFANRHTERVDSWTDDQPGPCDGRNVRTEWETYLVAISRGGPGIPANQFVVLAGWEWSVGRNNAGDLVTTGPAAINGNLMTINAAMGRSGFAGGNAWTAIANDINFVCIPSPGWAGMLAGVGLIAARRRRAS